MISKTIGFRGTLFSDTPKSGSRKHALNSGNAGLGRGNRRTDWYCPELSAWQFWPASHHPDSMLQGDKNPTPNKFMRISTLWRPKTYLYIKTGGCTNEHYDLTMFNQWKLSDVLGGNFTHRKNDHLVRRVTYQTYHPSSIVIFHSCVLYSRGSLV